MSDRNIPASSLKNAVFFTEADRIQQQLSHIGPKTLIRKIKLAALLSDLIVIPPSHIMESRISSRVFLEFPELLEKGIFAPSLPTKYANFAEFLQDKRNEFSYGFDYRPKRLDHLAEFLDTRASLVVRRDVDAMRQDFLDSLVRDLRDANSELSTRLGLSDGERTLFIQVISSMFVSRDTLLLLLENARLNHYQREVFISHLQALYCLAGARGNHSDPLVHPTLTSVYRSKFARILGGYDPRLFSAVLKGLGLSIDLLDRLTLREVVQLRDEDPVKKFRQKYLRLVDEARSGIPTDTNSFMHLKGLQKELEESVLALLDKKLVEEYRKVVTHNRVKRLWSIASFSTTLISAILAITGAPISPLATGVAAVSGVAGAINTFTGLTDPLIDRIFRTSGTEFILFATKMIEHEAETIANPQAG